MLDASPRTLRVSIVLNSVIKSKFMLSINSSGFLPHLSRTIYAILEASVSLNLSFRLNSSSPARRLSSWKFLSSGSTSCAYSSAICLDTSMILYSNGISSFVSP